MYKKILFLICCIPSTYECGIVIPTGNSSSTAESSVRHSPFERALSGGLDPCGDRSRDQISEINALLNDPNTDINYVSHGYGNNLHTLYEKISSHVYHGIPSFEICHPSYELFKKALDHPRLDIDKKFQIYRYQSEQAQTLLSWMVWELKQQHSPDNKEYQLHLDVIPLLLAHGADRRNIDPRHVDDLKKNSPDRFAELQKILENRGSMPSQAAQS